MKRLRCLPALLLLTSCERSPAPSPSVPATPTAFPDRPPVVVNDPVDAVSYEKGYEAGYKFGTAAATPRASVPSEAEVSKLAAEVSGEDPAHTAKWRRGWVAGYLDGFRARASGAK